MAVERLGEDRFAQEIQAQTDVALVDFYADWCGPCKMMAPLFEELSNETENCRFYKLNVDDAPSVAAKYGVMSIPTLIAFKGGEAVGKLVGAQGKPAVQRLIETARQGGDKR